jgi:hypothetical protein
MNEGMIWLKHLKITRALSLSKIWCDLVITILGAYLGMGYESYCPKRQIFIS